MSAVVACKICGKTFKSQRALSAHMAVHKHSTDNVARNPTSSLANTSGVGDSVVLQAMQMLDDGHTPIEIMQIHKLDVQTMKSILQDYRELSTLIRPEKTAAEALLQVARLFGERIRDGCDNYNEEQGICTEFSLYDIDEEFRRACPGLFKGSGGKTRFHVGNHPEVCSFCRRGVRRGET
jgi:hypothetical protein